MRTWLVYFVLPDLGQLEVDGAHIGPLYTKTLRIWHSLVLFHAQTLHAVHAAVVLIYQACAVFAIESSFERLGCLSPRVQRMKHTLM